MIKLQRITTADTALYTFMERLMETSFPPEEYRDLQELRTYTDNKNHFYNNIISEDEIPVGFITYWDFGTFCYIEHFAISPAKRNGGYGKKALEYLCRQLKCPMVLEVELPETEMSMRRINFYRRQGFVLWENHYEQPPYRVGNKSLPMLLMAYGNLSSERDYNKVRSLIYHDVYGCQHPDGKAKSPRQ